MTQNPLLGAQQPKGFQVSINTLTLGTLHEAILAFSSQDRPETFWPSVCQNVRWLIPSRRMAVLLATDERAFEIVGRFEQGRYQPTASPHYAPGEEAFNALLRKNNVQWFSDPEAQFHREGDALTTWLLRDAPATLFVLPVRAKGENIGAMLFAMNAVGVSDQAMLNTLGTIYSLHVGMTCTLIRVTEERRRMQDQMVMQEKMASLGNLVAGVAHEVNNPIGAVNSAADVSARCIATIEELLKKGATLEELQQHPRLNKALKLLRDNNQVVLTAGQRIARLVQSLKNFARLDEAEFKRVDIHEGLDSTLTLVQHELKDRVEIVREYGSLPPIRCYPNQLNQVFMNLFVNAAQAIDGKGQIRIHTAAEDQRIHIRIADTGKGIKPEYLARIFDPGFTTKGVGVGTGLGLSISYSIIEKHQGTIAVHSEVGRGTEFTISLPVDQTGI